MGVLLLTARHGYLHMVNSCHQAPHPIRHRISPSRVVERRTRRETHISAHPTDFTFWGRV
jgi:hypothetical protein